MIIRTSVTHLIYFGDQDQFVIPIIYYFILHQKRCCCYRQNRAKQQLKTREKNPEKKYILWKVQLEGYASIFLFGIIDNKVISISTNNDKISDEDQIKFLQEIYNKITVFKN